MHVVDQPGAAPRAHHVDWHDLIAILALELDAKRAPVVVLGHEHRPFQNPVSGMIEIFLNHGESLAQHVGIHVARRRAALRTPQLTHPCLIVGFHRGEKLRERLLHRLRQRTAGTLPSTTGGAAGEHQKRHREPSLHEP